MLDNTLNKSLPLDTRVYIYISQNNNVADNINVDGNNMNELIEELNIISEKADYIDQFGKDEYKPFNNYQKIFLDNISKYNSKVIKSRYIQKNYNYIVSLWNEAKTKLSSDEVYSNLEFENNDVDHIYKLINDGSVYFTNFQRNLHNDDWIQAKSNGLQVSNYTSFNIIVLLDFFNDAILHTSNKPFYHEINTSRGRIAKIIRYEDIAKKHKSKLKNIYCISQSELDKIKRLALEVMYYIVNVYPLLFDISNENNILGESTNKKIDDSFKIIQNSINKVKKLVNYNEKINVLESDIESKIRDMVELIINKY